MSLQAYGINTESLALEMLIFPRLFPTNTIIETVSGIVDGLKTVPEQTKLMFPLVLKLIKLLLVVPATSATAE